MTYIDPNRLFGCLITEIESRSDFSTSTVIARILAATATSGLAGFPHAILVDVPLGFEFLEEEAEVLVTCSLPQVFKNVRAAFNDELLRLEVRSMQTADTPWCTGGDANNRSDGSRLPRIASGGRRCRRARHGLPWKCFDAHFRVAAASRAHFQRVPAGALSSEGPAR